MYTYNVSPVVFHMNFDLSYPYLSNLHLLYVTYCCCIIYL